MQNNQQLLKQIQNWAKELGFQQLSVSDTHLHAYEPRLKDWLAKKYHGDMAYMSKHGDKRSRPEMLYTGISRVISVRMDYLPQPVDQVKALLDHPSHAYISRYALGRDYHKLMRKRLAQLCKRIKTLVGAFKYRVFVDSAPVMEKPLAEKAGLGWIGKHTNLINTQSGSWFFLGEIYTDLPLPVHAHASQNHCGDCRQCIDVCPTQAIVAPYILDARRCISYLTIEYRGSIPLELRPLIGNRIYGCDDCQLFCPWTRFSELTQEDDFLPRHDLDSAHLYTLFMWDETTFLKKTEGMAIRRTGYINWLRNIAVALGNGEASDQAIKALESRLDHTSDLVREHVAWALNRLKS